MTAASPILMGVYARDSVTWIRLQGRDDYGTPLTPTEDLIMARVHWQVKRVLDKGGNEVIAAGHILMAEKPLVDEDKIRIDGVEHLIVAADEVKSFTRILGYKAYIQ